MKKKIAWQYYVDPLNTNIDDVEFPGFDKMPFDIDEENMSFPLMPEYGGPPLAMFEGNQPGIHKDTSMKVIKTPFGFISMTEASQVTANLDLWVMHTNFDITNKVAELLENIKGVESLNVMSRYRVRLGFPKSGLFQTASIKKRVEAVLLSTNTQVDQNTFDILSQQFNEEIATKTAEIRDGLQNKSDYWIIYITPNGQYEIVTSQYHCEEFAAKARTLFEANQIAGGHIVSFTDYEVGE